MGVWGALSGKHLSWLRAQSPGPDGSPGWAARRESAAPSPGPRFLLLALSLQVNHQSLL